MMHGGYAIDGKGIVYFAKGYSVSVMSRRSHHQLVRKGEMFVLAHTQAPFSEGLDTSPCVLQVEFMTVMLRVYSAEAERYIDPL